MNKLVIGATVLTAIAVAFRTVAKKNEPANINLNLGKKDCKPFAEDIPKINFTLKGTN